jgi:hypothetical protein
MSNTTKVKKLAVNNRVYFQFYRKGELWYELREYIPDIAKHMGWEKCATGPAYVALVPPFLFPVPVADTGDGLFHAEDKALTYMRWIRRHVEFIEEARQAHDTAIQK